MKAKTEGLIYVITFFGVLFIVHLGFIDLLINNQNNLIYYSFVLITITVFDTIVIISIVLVLLMVKYKVVRR